MNDSHAAAPETGVAASRTHRHWQRRAMAVCLVSALVLGTAGYRAYQPETSLPNALYHAVQLFALHAPHFERPVPWALECGRWLAAATTLFAACQVVRRIWREEWHAHRLGCLRGHVIVCGLGRKGMGLVRRLRQPPSGRAAECDQRGGLLRRQLPAAPAAPARPVDEQDHHQLPSIA
jgi:hypothetical protein